MLRSLPNELQRSLRLTLVAVAVTLVYTFVITGVSQLAFNHQANGSLITRNGQVIGSQLIGQQFTSPRYFHGRPSATMNDAGSKAQPYNAESSAGSNLAPSNQALAKRVSGDVQAIHKSDPSTAGKPVPVDLVTTDFSGFDPDISEAAALYQVDRVARARGLPASRVRALVESHVQGRVLGIFGEPHVNVLALNLALDPATSGAS